MLIFQAVIELSYVRRTIFTRWAINLFADEWLANFFGLSSHRLLDDIPMIHLQQKNPPPLSITSPAHLKRVIQHCPWSDIARYLGFAGGEKKNKRLVFTVSAARFDRSCGFSSDPVNKVIKSLNQQLFAEHTEKKIK